MSAARTRRWALAATPILAAHLGLALLMHGQAEPIVERFLETSFDGGRHARRVAKIAAVERHPHPSDEEE